MNSFRLLCRVLFVVLCMATFVTPIANAQDNSTLQTEQTEIEQEDLQQKVEEALEEEIEIPMPPPMMEMPAIKFRWLNKITARNKTVEAKVGETVKIGGLYMKARTCQKASPLENPESAAFLQIWEGGDGNAAPEWVFSGWMFASSPGLSAMDHPVYDVWVLSCLDDDEAPVNTSIKADDEDEAQPLKENDANVEEKDVDTP